MAKLTDVMGRPFSGIVPYCVVGLVTDNVDPDELGRIQVKFPTLHEEPLSFWLRQIAPMAGKERGVYALPEIEDEVLVIFMQGSHDVGVIIGQFWNGVDIPPQECKDKMPKPADSGKLERSKDEFTDGSKDLEKNDRRFWKSRAGSLFVFDDTDGSETVQIWDHKHNLCLIFDPNEERIVLANSKGDLHIRTKNDLYLEAGNDIIYTAKNNMDGLVHNDWKLKVDMNYDMDTGMDVTEKAGMNWTSEAGMNWTTKAGMAYKIEGSMTFEAKGGISAKVEGSAMTTIKGGVVMIN